MPAHTVRYPDRGSAEIVRGQPRSAQPGPRYPRWHRVRTARSQRLLQATTINILSTLLTPDAGTVRVAGFDVASQADEVRASIGVTGQFAAVDKLLTGEENLRLMARLAHLDSKTTDKHIADLLDQFDLAEAARKPSSTYSGGMRRRLDLAMSWCSTRRSSSSTSPRPASTRSTWQ